MVTTEITTKEEQVNLASPKDIMGFANDLKDIIVKNQLYTNIRGKNYVNVEGWQIAGAFTGTLPIVEKVEDLSEMCADGKYKYRAEVTLRDQNGAVVGSGTAICTNTERGKENFDEYAVASMAQTRAVGKAFRMKIGWLLKIAGYETTPAEEMDAIQEADVVKNKTTKKKASKIEFSEVWKKVDSINSVEELEEYWKSLNLSENQAKALKKSFAKRKEQLNGVE